MARRADALKLTPSQLDGLGSDYLTPSTSRRQLRFDVAFAALRERSSDPPLQKQLSMKARIAKLDRFLDQKKPYGKDPRVIALGQQLGVDPQWLDQGLAEPLGSQIPDLARAAMKPYAGALQAFVAIEIWRAFSVHRTSREIWQAAPLLKPIATPITFTDPIDLMRPEEDLEREADAVRFLPAGPRTQAVKLLQHFRQAPPLVELYRMHPIDIRVAWTWAEQFARGPVPRPRGTTFFMADEGVAVHGRMRAELILGSD